MRFGLKIIPATVVVAIAISGDCRAAVAAPSKTLVFEGTVTAIRNLDHALTPWLITVKVTKVVSGEFSATTFQFVVHSPSRAGLEKGKSYTIEAVWRDGAYVVDENQWRRPKRLRTGTRSENADQAVHSTGAPGVKALIRGILQAHAPSVLGPAADRACATCTED